MIAALILIPLVGGVASLLVRSVPARRLLLVGAALGHTALTASLWASWPERPAPLLDGWLALDAPGLLVLTLASLLFLAAAVYSVGYLAHENHGGRPRRDFEEGSFFVNEPEAIFSACLLFFLGSMSAVALSHHFGLLWVAVEATTLASAPLIYFHRHHRSLEATWKYVLICSVGIALALLGNFALAAAADRPDGGEASLALVDLLHGAGALKTAWLKTAMVFLLIGYGTKMGLAPLHTWLPDAHSEAPSLVSALLSGALLNCAFLGILRGHQVCVAAGEGEFSGGLLIGFGLLSMAIAAAFIVGQADFKRLLAYSSVEHMGVLALGVGLGGAYGSALHAVNHSLAKGGLFLTAGNLLAVYRTKQVAGVAGALRRVPVTGALWLAGFLAITGTPPFGTFLSEFAILRTALDSGRYAVAVAYLAFLALIFLGMAALVLPMVQGLPPARDEKHGERGLGLWLTLPPAVLVLLVLGLGIYVPPVLDEVLRDVALVLTGKALG